MKLANGLAFTLLLLLSAGPVAAQKPPPGPAAAKPVDPVESAAQAAFEALPEAERRAIQNDLVWVTDYYGASLGTFGKLTYNALVAFQKQIGGRQDGILDPQQRQQMATLAQRNRAAIGFKVVTDPVTGSGIGIAASLGLVQEKTVQGTKWSKGADFILETVKTTPDHADMAATFDRFVNAAAPGRKVTYKLLRPDFFVVTGDSGTQKFYTRFAPTQDGLRGYTVTYNPKWIPNIDQLVIAIANTFEPIAAGAAPAATPKTAPTAGTGTATPSALAPPPAAPKTASVLLLGGGYALAPSGALDGCRTPSVNGKPAQVVGSDAGSGAALLKVESADAPAPTLAQGDTGADAVAFGFSGGHLQAAPGTLRGDGKTFTASAQPGMWGSLILSPTGQVRGLLADDPTAKPHLGGVVLASSYRVIAADQIAAAAAGHLAAGSDGNTAARTTGELAQIAAKMVAPLTCGP
ncbi:peptidoglycan-binding protein [Methylovirgula sp. 4M-Z18]|uniref:peptidoglycan-binding protein n=1 Tax=Methylovirgula sp. 4M-Z18 TaxID=2293567 RepID=UPI000E2EF893|nr:peptidoglycan-binding protein [Methylovirgula sp. 4M-Z18]RFB79053.1 hypothetical protein DYH55_14665 [Methylovirgula sp. 4M-Z18]